MKILIVILLALSSYYLWSRFTPNDLYVVDGEDPEKSEEEEDSEFR